MVIIGIIFGILGAGVVCLAQVIVEKETSKKPLNVRNYLIGIALSVAGAVFIAIAGGIICAYVFMCM